MTKRRKGFNWKARQQVPTTVENTNAAKVSVEIEGLKEDVGYDDSNALALSTTKTQAKNIIPQAQKTKKLSKKERKKLEKVLEQKEKKAKRASVLESLATLQASQDVMNQLVGIADVQTGRVKRKHDTVESNEIKVNTIAGSNKRRKRGESESESDSDESVHTSDMSSDDEDEAADGVDTRSAETLDNVDDEMETNIPESDVKATVGKSQKEVQEIKSNSDGGDDGKDARKHSTCSEFDSKCVNNKIVFVEIDEKVRTTCGKWKVKEKRIEKSNIDPTSCSSVDHSKLGKSFELNTVTSESKKTGKALTNTDTNLKENGLDTCDVKLKEDKNGSKDSSGKASSLKLANVPVTRDKSIQEGRLKLPILGEEQVVMEAINENPVVIVCGETGSGKTTQVPQFLYEAGYAHGGGIIGITEPRRVAAITMSNRVAMEMSLSSREVSYQIRYEGNVTPDTKVKFMTDGVLLKEVQKDFLLSKYSAIIIDEAHERSMYTDILIGLLSRIGPLRHKQGNPLKLIIMSATLRVEDFTENKRLFKVTPPVIKVDSRQFPVTIHYNKRTPLDSYLNEAYRKTCKIHKMLPEGGILLFVTGQQEVHTLCKKLKQTFPLDKNAERQVVPKQKRSRKSSGSEKPLPEINLDNYSVAPVDEEAEREGGDSDLDLSDTEDLGYHEDDLEEDDLGIDTDELVTSAGGCSQPLYVLPLYSLLSSEKQAKVFGPVPEGCRLCVVATNVAETSLTIPNIKYVVDTGKVKTKFYDKVTGVSTFRITWTSKAGANQRAGRAGRVGPGHCYRLYSSAVFNDEFEKFSAAEITRRPVDDLVLQMKDMNIEKVVNFPYPTPPDLEQIQAAEHLLVSLGALHKPDAPRSFRETKKATAATITPLGRAMACFPVSPRYAKMLALSHQHGLLPYAVVIVAALSVQELFMEVHCNPQDETQKEQFKQRLVKMLEIKRRWAGAGHSLLLGDLMVMLKAVGSCEYEGCSPSFCEAHGIRYKAMKEVRKLRAQLTNTVNSVILEANICVDPKMAPPDDIQAKLLRQIVLAGMADHVARKLPDLPSLDPNAKKMKHAYQCPDLEDPVFIHPTSVLYKQKPEYVVFQHIGETSKLYMKGIVAVEPAWLSVFAQSHVTLSKPMDSPPPDYDSDKDQVTCHMTGTFGNCSWPLPAVPLEYPTGLDKMRWFARFLLEGKVIKVLGKFTPDLLSAPTTMIKTWAKLQPRTESLLKALIAERVDSRKSLQKVWEKQPNYLLREMEEWLPQLRHGELALLWPPK